jgi:hypothetical protein
MEPYKTMNFYNAINVPKSGKPDCFPLNKSVWKLKRPLKIKVFDWFVLKGVILTKYNLLKRN